jgi:acetyl esterase/lipase
MGLVRFRAAEWHIDPHKIGVLGFSAGGHMVAAMSTHFGHRLYPAVDSPTKKAAARILRWLFIRGICGLPIKSLS